MNYPFPQTDRELAQKQLSYLGYTSNQAFLRFFYHSDNPKKDKDKGRKSNNLDWRAIASYQQDEAWHIYSSEWRWWRTRR